MFPATVSWAPISEGLCLHWTLHARDKMYVSDHIGLLSLIVSAVVVVAVTLDDA